jgi:alkylation response protein AidB-like acyl-CoA dehydrogenase
MIADNTMQTEAARNLTYQASSAVDPGIRGSELTYLAAVSKCFASDTALMVSTDAVRLLGLRESRMSFRSTIPP